MSDSAQAVQPFLLRRQKNLEFFKRRHPKMFEFFKDYKLKNIKVDILPEIGEVDIIEDGRHMYKGGAKTYVENEIEEFKKVFSQGRWFGSLNPTFGNAYCYDQYFHRRCDEVIQKSPFKIENYRGYRLEDFYPQVVFLGCGLGYHIEKMLQENSVHHVFIVEPNTDYFAASLYAVDWAKILEPYAPANGKSCSFIIGSENDEYTIWAVTWNHLVQTCPLFPVSTFFYNHRGLSLFDRVSDKINEDLYLYLGSWGHFDDELRQLNNAIHNFHLDIPCIPDPKKDGFDVPVCIVGGGPSLDARIELIKKYRDKIVLVSCGTALRTLYCEGLKPDIHIELESDYCVYLALEHIPDKDYLKSIKLICPSHLNPAVSQLFGEKRIYFKAESAIASLFGATEKVIANATPTCTNAGVGVALHQRLKNIFFFGMDYGFADKTKHHASGSVYYEDKAPDNFKTHVDYKPKDLIQVTSVRGEKIYTTPVYFSCKRKIEHEIKYFTDRENTFTFYNCSDGAEIEGSTWLSNQEFEEVIACEFADRKEDVMEYLFSKRCKPVNKKKIGHGLKYLEENLKALSHDLNSILEVPPNNLEEMTTLISKIGYYLESVVRIKAGDFYYFVRGAVRHFMHIGYSHAFALNDAESRKEFTDMWFDKFKACFEDMVEHYRKTVYKKFDINTDPLVHYSFAHNKRVS